LPSEKLHSTEGKYEVYGSLTDARQRRKGA
jgi:hypothetical protein